MVECLWEMEGSFYLSSSKERGHREAQGLGEPFLFLNPTEPGTHLSSTDYIFGGLSTPKFCLFFLQNKNKVYASWISGLKGLLLDMWSRKITVGFTWVGLVHQPVAGAVLRVQPFLRAYRRRRGGQLHSTLSARPFKYSHFQTVLAGFDFSLQTFFSTFKHFPYLS